MGTAPHSLSSPGGETGPRLPAARGAAVSGASGRRGSRTLLRAPTPLVGRICQRAVTILAGLVLVVAPLTGGPVHPWLVQLLELAVGLAAFCWLLRILWSRQVNLVRCLFAVPLLLFATLVIVRYGLAEIEAVARPALMLTVAAALFFFLVLNNVASHRELNLLVGAWTVLGALLALSVLWGNLLSGSWALGLVRFLPRLAAAPPPVRSLDTVIDYLTLVLPMATATVLFSRHSLRGKLLLAAGSALMAVGLCASPARYAWAGLLAAALVIGIYLLRKHGYRFEWGVVTAITVSAAFLVILIVVLFANAFAANPTQYPLWQSAAAIGRDNLWLGGGPGMFTWLYPAHRTVAGQPTAVSNEYLNLFAEYGLVGLGLGLWFLVAFIVAAVQILAIRMKRYSAATPSNRFAFTVGGLAAVVGLAVQALFNGAGHTPANLLTLLAIMALVLTCGIHPTGRVDADVELAGRYATVKLTQATKWVLVVGLGVVGGLLAITLRRSLPATLLLHQAAHQQAHLHWNAAQDCYLDAWRHDRDNFACAAALGDFYAARGTWNLRQRAALYDQALGWYARAYAANPYAAAMLIQRGRLLDVLGKRQPAEEQLRLALNADPANPAWYTQLGLHYQRWNQSPQAIASFRRAVELGDPDPLPRLQLRQLGVPDS